jgi:thiamine biosynthesis lipoprotein
VTDSYVHTVALMGTVVTVQVVGHGAGAPEQLERQEAVQRAIAWFHRVSDACSRFDEQSELRRLSGQIGVRVPVSPMLYEAVRFAIAMAAETEGAFDPTVGLRMEVLGFNREYRTGRTVRTFSSSEPPEDVTYRDVRLDPDGPAITLLRPLVLDLGAVAKGLAVDLAAKELRPFANFAVDAGGDLYLGGHNADDKPWSVGIRHPRNGHELMDTLCVSDIAVCTSGDYERRGSMTSGDGDIRDDEGHHLRAAHGGHHLMDARTGLSATAAASVTVLAPSAMVADALATAAFVLGPAAGLGLLERHRVDGVIVTPALERFATPGMADFLANHARNGSALASRDS